MPRLLNGLPVIIPKIAANIDSQQTIDPLRQKNHYSGQQLYVGGVKYYSDLMALSTNSSGRKEEAKR
jgi:hypothetical protein